MKLGSLFGQQKTLARPPRKDKAPRDAGKSDLKSSTQALINATKKKPGDFGITWPKLPVQKVKDYQLITTLAQLEDYLHRCEQTGLGGFDYETAAADGYRTKPIYDKDGNETGQEPATNNALDPWKADICTCSIAAAPHEARVIFISHKKGKRLFEPQLTRETARKLVMDTLDKYFFRNPKIVKIAVNLAFETKQSAKHAKYILPPVADPLIMWTRCLQVAAPQHIKDPKKPTAGLGLKRMTFKYMGVTMGDFKKLLAKHGAGHFDEMDTENPEAVTYSAEDSDYAVQHYLYWNEIALQIPTSNPIYKNYSEWLHGIEMPFGRVIGLMEYWGMAWDTDLAQVRKEEAEIAQEKAAEEIKRICKEALDLDVNPGKSGKTNEVKAVIFDYMKIPAAKWSNKTGDASLDEEAIIDMRFMLENNLISIDEEKFLAVPLPDGWESIDPNKDPGLDKVTRGAVRIAQRQPHPYKEAGLALLDQLQKIQKYSTLLSSHINGRAKYLHDVSGRIHANYTPWTRTARLESHNPNGQNVPRPDNDDFKIRSFYVPGPGKILFFIDFSGFELRLMAWKSGDAVMIDIFKHGGDMHKRTASVATEKPEEDVSKKERQDAKPANFGICYGGTEHALQKTFKTDYLIRKSLEECAALVNAVKKAYEGIPAYQRSIALEAREKGYVETIYGYIRMLPHINSTSQYNRGKDERRAANTPIQGSAADIMKRCQNAVYDEIGRGTGLAFDAQELNVPVHNLADELGQAPPILQHGSTDMIAQIHDEIIFEMDDEPDVVEKAWKWVKAEMEKPPLLDFPIPVEAEASVGYRWNEKQNPQKWLDERKGA